MVAAAKLRKAQERMFAVRPYADKLNSMLYGALVEGSGDYHPLIDTAPSESGNVSTTREGDIGIIVIAGDRGLCGAFNANIIRTAEEFVSRHNDRKFQVLAIGKKTDNFFRKRNFEFIESFKDIYDSVSTSKMILMAGFLIEKYLRGELAQVLLFYNEFVNVIKQKQVVKQIVPIDPSKLELSEDFISRQHEAKDRELFVVEPDENTLRDALLRRFVASEIHHAVLESIASEFGARMTAMDLATKNADEMIDNLTLDLNRARQATITREIVEISGGAEAMTQK